jgi:multidrug efflux pump subunit AcrA (membrane-fusion protein)
MGERINGFLGSLKALKLWQIGLLVIVILGSAGTTYGVYASSSGANEVELGENQRVIPVQYGDLMNQISTNGSLTFPEKEALRFNAAGTVAEVLVKEGQHVTRGQVLARLDESAVASLEEAVAEARVAMRDAQNSLSALELEHAVQLAEAEEAVTTAEFDLETAFEALDDAREPYTNQEIKAQQQLVAEARLALQTAQKALLDLEPNHSLELAQAIQANRDARATLEDARKSLGRLENDHGLELALATQAKAAAQVALDEAKTALEDYKNSGGANLERLRVQKARAEDEVAELQSRIDRLVAAQEDGSGSLTSSIRSLQNLMESSQERLADLQAQVAEVEQLEAAVELAEQELKDARDGLADLESGPAHLRRQQLEAAVEVAQANVMVSEKALADLLSGVDSLEVALKEAEVSAAEATLEQAEKDLVEMLEGADPTEVAQKEKQVALARANLAKARGDWEALSEDPDPLELAVRQAKVASAQRALDDAVQRVEDSTLRSTIDGLVTQVNVEEGDEVHASAGDGGSGLDASSVIVEIVDTTVVEIDGIVDEIDVLSVQEGIPVRVTLDALPGQTFEGVVTRVAPAAESQQGVVTYPISIQVEVPAELQLREGLTTVASIVLNEEKNVLLVPQQALYGTYDQPVVQVVTPTGIEERRVSLGNTDGFWVAVSEGLQEGDQVVMESAAVSTTGGGFGQIRTISGGGRGPR